MIPTHRRKAQGNRPDVTSRRGANQKDRLDGTGTDTGRSTRRHGRSGPATIRRARQSCRNQPPIRHSRRIDHPAWARRRVSGTLTHRRKAQGNHLEVTSRRGANQKDRLDGAQIDTGRSTRRHGRSGPATIRRTRRPSRNQPLIHPSWRIDRPAWARRKSSVIPTRSRKARELIPEATVVPPHPIACRYNSKLTVKHTN